ncbi:hypothetical protein [Streptomyces sp. NPDC021224]|uniref:hypothetical protein n=1 Tax=unclassified Streptomyces TaxID=2593676 RepID=UPI0037895796
MSRERTAVLRLAGQAAEVSRLAAAALGGEGAEDALPRPPGAAGTVAVVGPRDCGKTTLVRSLLGCGPGDAAALAALDAQWAGPVAYVHGPGPGVEVLGWDGAHWRPAFGTPGKTGKRAAEVRAVRVRVASEVLKGGHRVVDVPGFDGVLGDLAGYAAELAEPGVGVLYVLPERGLSEVDVQAFEALRGRRPVIVQGMRDEQLTPSRSLVQPVEVPVPDWPHALPLIVSGPSGSGAAPDARSREVLLECLAVLRAGSLPPGTASALLAWTGEVAARLPAVVAERAAAARGDARADTAERRVAAWGALARLLRDTRTLAPLDGLLEALRRDAGLTRAVGADALRARVARAAPELADRCNVRAGRRRTGPDRPEQAPQTDFARGYLRARVDLHELVANLAAHAAALELIEKETEALLGIRQDLASDSIEIAMLGRFTSGKSALVNAVLGQPFGDRSRTLLPTSVRPETATVNEVSWAGNQRVLGVDWRTRADLVFLAAEPGRPPRFRVRPDEIAAFDAWLRSRQVAPEDCTFELVRGRAERSAAQRGDRRTAGIFDGTVRLLRSLGAHGTLPHFVYPHGTADPDGRVLPDEPVAARVEVHAFAGEPWTKATKPGTVAETFRRVQEDLGVALRIGTLRLGFPLELLKYVTFIDTPGTDSPKPHHAEIAGGLITDRKCTVLYCIAAGSPGAREDTENLRRVLRHLRGREGLARLFVAVTAVDLEQPSDLPEIRRKVLDQLRALGVAAPKVYLTDVRNRNGGFRDLVRDLGDFAAADRRPHLVLRARQVSALLAETDRRLAADVRLAHAGAAARAATLAEVDARLSALVRLRKEAAASAEWGLPWVLDRVKRAVALDRRQTAGLVNGLGGAATYDDAETDVQGALDRLDGTARRAVTELLDLLADNVRERAEAAGVTSPISEVPAQPAGALFPSAPVVAAVDAAVWRTRWQRTKDFFSGSVGGSDTERNRARVVAAWEESDRTGLAALTGRARTGWRHLDGEIARLIDSLLAQRPALSQPMSRARLDEIGAIRADLERWRERLAAYERTVDGGERRTS